jgi:hypothetical protein
VRRLFWLLLGRCPIHHDTLMEDKWLYEEKGKRDCFHCPPHTDEGRYPYGLRNVLRDYLSRRLAFRPPQRSR